MEPKEQLQAFVTQQEKSLMELENRYLDEKVRLTNQIRAAKNALAKWDGATDSMIASLQAAGLKVRT